MIGEVVCFKGFVVVLLKVKVVDIVGKLVDVLVFMVVVFDDGDDDFDVGDVVVLFEEVNVSGGVVIGKVVKDGYGCKLGNEYYGYDYS